MVYKTPDKQIKVAAAAKGRGLIIDLGNSHGWYDLSIKVKGNTAFEKRHAGEVETGNPGCSDPYMGNV